MTNRIHSEVPAIKIKIMKMNEQQQLQHHHQQRQIVTDLMEQHHHRRRRRASFSSESSVEAMDLARTPNQSVKHNGSSPSSSRSEHIDSDNFESDAEDYSTNYKRQLSQHTNFARGVGDQERRNSRNSSSHSYNGGNTRKKIRSSTPNRGNNNNNNTAVSTTTHNSSIASSLPSDRTQNESGFVDVSSSQHLNSSPEPLSATDRDDVKYICPICEVVSATPHEFTNHIRCHNYSSGDTENFTCRICSKVLSSASSLDRHVLVHTGERPFNCKYCHLTFTTNGNMHRHMRTHKQHMQTRNTTIAGGGGGVGNGNSNNNNGINRNLAPPSSGGSGGGTSSGNGDAESEESDGCSTDSSASSSNNIIKYNNNNNNNNNNYNKRKSTDDESTGGTLKRRIKTTINNNIISESELEYTGSGQQKYSCPLCSRNDFSDMFTLGSHMDREHPGIPAKCRQCEMVFKSHKSLNAHRCSQQKINVTHGFKDMTFIDFSSEKFPLIAKSLCEQSIHTPITSQKFECPKCRRAFPCASAVDIHVKDCGDSLVHDYSIRKRGSSESSEEEIRRDEFFAHLDLRNKSAMSLASTMSSPRTSEKSDSNVKTDHERNTATSHSGTYNCNESKDLADIQSILNVTSSSNSFLRNFENVVNTPPASDYILGKDEEEAQDAFTSEFRKMKLRGEFPCKLCTAVYPNLRALKGHNRVHLSAAGAGPYRCNMCPYSVHDKAALIRHMRTHNGDRPYECAVCNYAFTTKANCERHLRNRHAKTTRDEVKRAIIYHPSEDSSCEDPIKKLQMFSSPEFDEDDHPSAPKDRSTPVSHLKEMLQSTSPIKIQVKSLEKLMDTSNVSVRSTEEKGSSEQDTSTTSVESARPMDLSMDVLDLSKKAKIDEPKPVEKLEPKPEDFSTLEKNHQWLLAQQQIFKDSLSQMDPAHYLQLSQLYRNLMFPSIPPFLFPNSFLPNNFGDLNKFPPMLLNPLFPGSAESGPQESGGMRPTVPQPSLGGSHSPLKGPENPPTSLQLPPSMPQQLTLPRHPLAGSQPPQSMLAQIQNTGPVKMVIKNGVLMPKQKQRRYRTERPFTCEHCAARFTLRSNMERHVKQQHPQFWAQRQRSGHHIMRRSGSVMSQMGATSISPQGTGLPPNHFSAISDQVKYAILAHQLKAPKDSDILQQALTQKKINLDSNHLNMANNNLQSNMMGSNGFEDDDPKLIIDEGNEGNDEAEEEEDEDDDIYEESKPEDLSSNVPVSAAKQVAENILEQARKVISHVASIDSAADDDCELNDQHNMDASNSMLAQAESVGKYLKKVANSSFKEDSSDLVPVSKLVDNATNSMSSFNNYFRPTDMANTMEQSDEEGLVASGSTSESNNSGNEEPLGNNGPEGKRKSAYSLAPNRVSCNYCQRTFPWTSSLRRHILTHTGQKPFKCSHCPLLFTTKSNCDRHLLRKHGNVESAVSLYVPIADIPDPIPMPRTEERTEEQHKPQLVTANNLNLTVPNLKAMEPLMSSSDLPFKCHLCDSSFAERNQCLDHIKISHYQEFALLLAKGAIDAEAEHNQIHSTEDDERCGEGRGKYPDYANRKVMCAFCMRRFWSTEDLRRHMRTHSGERPFQCEVCLRKFTLKHSMLRHMKKHSNGHNNNQSNHLNSGSDMSEDEQPPPAMFHKNPLLTQKIREALSRAEAWRQSNLSGEQKEKNGQPGCVGKLRNEKDNGASGAPGNEENSDLISDLLGITGQGILNKLLSSPDEAAKLLGVDK